jgi:hypothetical protein
MLSTQCGLRKAAAVYNKEFLKTYKPLPLSCIQIWIRSDASCISDRLLFSFQNVHFWIAVTGMASNISVKYIYIIYLSKAILFLNYFWESATFTHTRAHIFRDWLMKSRVSKLVNYPAYTNGDLGCRVFTTGLNYTNVLHKFHLIYQISGVKLVTLSVWVVILLISISSAELEVTVGMQAYSIYPLSTPTSLGITQEHLPL